MSSTQLPPPEVSPEDEVLAYTQGMRRRIVNKLTNDGKTIPGTESKDILILNQTLDSMDKAALGKMRIKVEEKANQTQEQAAGMIAQLLQKVTSQKPFEVIEGVAREIPQLPESVPAPRLVEGETATVAAQQDFDTFTARFTPDGSGAAAVNS